MSENRGNHDDASAAFRPGSRFGPGFVSSSSLSPHTLPEGTRLREYEVVGLVGEGGFGIVYLAYDHSLHRHVAVKEYMPASIASRAPASVQMIVKSDRHQETFQAGLKSFVNEARLLARFDNPSLVKVYRFWEQNGTAYMAMPYYEGPTLKRALAELGRPPEEAELRAWLRPLLDALTAMHNARCYHRDIAPDNILLTLNGPLLLDFGAARRVIGDMTHALTVVLKPGFAPVEQYGEVASMSQGAWTDLYALASVVHYAITGSPPMSSVERLMSDQLVPLSTRFAGTYSAPFLHAIDAALAVKPRDRPQSVAEFRDLLDGRGSSSMPASGFAPTLPADLLGSHGAVPRAWVPPTRPPAEFQESSPQPASAEPRDEAPAVPVLDPSTSVPAEVDVSEAESPAPAHSRRSWMVATAAALLVVAAGGTYLATRNNNTEAPTPPPMAKASAALPATPLPTPTTVAPAPAVAQATDAAAPPHAARPASVRPAPARASAPARSGETSTQCSDILQKASLEPLTPSEAEFMRKECR